MLLIVVGLMAAVVSAVPHAMPQGVTDIITPSSPAPSGCTASYSGSFGIAVSNITATVPSNVEAASQTSE